MACTEAFVLSGVSERKYAHFHALTLYASMKELRRQGLMTEVVPLSTVC